MIESLGLPQKVLAVLDRNERQIHISQEISNENHKRFGKAHEVGHDLCDWHERAYEFDGKDQLSPTAQDLFEQEANYAAARLLFQGPIFSEIAKGLGTSKESIFTLAVRFGASLHSTFHHYVALNPDYVLGYVLSRSPTLAVDGSLQFRILRLFTSTKASATGLVLPTQGNILSSRDVPALVYLWGSVSTGVRREWQEFYILTKSGSGRTAMLDMFSNSRCVFVLVDASYRHAWRDRRRVASARV